MEIVKDSNSFIKRDAELLPAFQRQDREQIKITFILYNVGGLMFLQYTRTFLLCSVEQLLWEFVCAKTDAYACKLASFEFGHMTIMATVIDSHC